MKRKMPLLLCAFLLLIVGCSTKTQGEKEKEVVSKPTEKTVKQEKHKISKNNKKNTKSKEQPKYKINEANWSIEPIEKDTNEKVVLLTIDDAPDRYAVEMAKTLKDLKVPAIFFVNGHFLETAADEENLKEIYNMGFDIGNHTYSHKSLPDLTKAEQEDEILKVNQKVERTIGYKPSFFRAPFGQNTDVSKHIVKQENMHLMNWTFGYDWEPEYQSKDALLEVTLNNEFLNNGSNILMHDREWTNAALKEIVKGLDKQGYTFVDPKEIKGYSKTN